MIPTSTIANRPTLDWLVMDDICLLMSIDTDDSCGPPNISPQIWNMKRINDVIWKGAGTMPNPYCTFVTFAL